MILLGLLIGTIGMDPSPGRCGLHTGSKISTMASGSSRGDGAFGVGEILSSTEESLVRLVHKIKSGSFCQPGRASCLLGPHFSGNRPGLCHRSVAGFCPCAGEFCQLHARKASGKRPEEFGTGRIEGVAGPETANNAASESAMIRFSG